MVLNISRTLILIIHLPNGPRLKALIVLLFQKNLPSLQLPDGLYAVFTFKGLVTAFPNYMEYIFTEWLPHSIYDVSKRPHFNILNEMFKKNDTQTEETIWIPIQLKGNPN